MVNGSSQTLWSRRRFRWLVGAMSLACSACSHLEARKVPLADRHSGADKHVDGFRYYQPRPYIVVAERVPLADSRKLGVLVQRHNREVIAIVDKLGQPTEALYELDGKPYDPKRPAEAPRELPVPPKDGIEQTGAGAPKVEPKAEPARIDPVALEQRFKNLDAKIDKLAKADPAPAVAPKLQEVQQPPKPESFQVVMLPDFEEQMAVKDKNWLASSSYTLNFQDGWGLASVGGEWNATQVPVRILQTIGTAMTAYADVQKKALLTLPITKEEIESARKNYLRGFDGKPRVYVLVTESHFIPPGMYRLQKPGEAGAAHGAGLLTELGIPTRTDVKVQLIADEK